MTITLAEALQDSANTPDGIITGDATNNVNTNKTQGVRYNGTSTVWKDMVMGLFGKRLLSTSGKVDYDCAYVHICSIEIFMVCQCFEMF